MLKHLMHMYTCIYIYIHIYMCIYICTHTHIYVYTHTSGFPVGLKTGWKFFKIGWTSHVILVMFAFRRLFQGGSRNETRWSFPPKSTSRGNTEFYIDICETYCFAFNKCVHIYALYAFQIDIPKMHVLGIYTLLSTLQAVASYIAAQQFKQLCMRTYVRSQNCKV